MKKILVVGHCYSDSKALKKKLEADYNASIIEVSTISEAESFLNKNTCDLIFVNRITTGDKKQGLELIKYVKENCPNKPIFMLTRFPESQKEAIDNGAEDAFDIDFIIGYIRPSMKEKEKFVIQTLNKYLLTQ